MVFSFLLSLYGGWREGRFALAAIDDLFTRPMQLLIDDC
jgi:hypothetical protein